MIKGENAMTQLLKKTVAMMLALCSLFALWMPTVQTASAAEFQFPEYGKTMEIGETLLGGMSMPQHVDIMEYKGRQYLGVATKGGRFYVFDLTACLEEKPNQDGNYIYDWARSGIGIPRGLAQDSKGNFYAVGDSSSVFWYNIRTGKSGNIATGSSTLQSVTVDSNDNIYVGGKGGSGAAVYRINGSTHAVSRIYTTSELVSAQALVYGGGKLYIQGGFRSGEGSRILQLSTTGDELDSYTLSKTGGSYYLSYISGVVFLGGDGANEDGLVALDTTGGMMTRLNVGKNKTILGAVTNPRNGKAYMVLQGDGIYEYDIATRKLGKRISTAGSRQMRARNAYINYGDSTHLISVGPSSVTSSGKISGNASLPSLGALLEGGYSTFSARSITSGVAGTGTMVYVGAYLSSSVSSYTPGAENPIDHKVFSNGHAQTDNMITYNGKIYGGAYSGGYLFEYDPKTGTFRELIHGLKADYNQLRIHGLAAGDNKIFFSTIPNDKALGGCIGWYDLSNDTWYCERNTVTDQAVITLAYDEEKDILYGGTTIRGGTNTTPTTEQAVLFAYDVNTKKVLAQTTVGSLTGDKPRFISGIARDPATGKLWGSVAQTVFSFTLENGSLKLTKEWAAPTNPSDPYPDGGSKSWFPRPILFDGNGGMYIGMNEERYGITKFTLGTDGKIKKATTVVESTTRIYTLGADGNLYYDSGILYMVTLNRATMVKEMIDTTRQTDREGIAQIRLAYDALTKSEQDQLGKTYYDKLLLLESGEEGLEQISVEKAIAAIDGLGAITVTSGGELAKARMYCDSVSENGKAKITNYQKLLDMEAAFAAICAKTQWNEEKSQTFKFSKSGNNRIENTSLKDITFDHITGGTWEFATSTDGKTMDFNGNDSIRLDLSDNGWIALRIKVSEAGLYDVKLDTKDYKGCLGGIYLFPAAGTGNQWKDAVNAEMGMGVAFTDHYVGSVDFSQSGTAAVGKWKCDAPGEYILAINCLQTRSGSYATVKFLTLTKREPVADATVELVKSRINAIGKITKHSGRILEEARITYNALTQDQKSLIYAVVLEEKEAAYALVKEQVQNEEQDNTAAALVQVQINTIGTVTAASGPIIEMARQAYDALTPEQQAKVSNAQVLFDAEEAFKAFASHQPADETEKDRTGTVILVIVLVFVTAAGAVLAVIFLKKKKTDSSVTDAPSE